MARMVLRPWNDRLEADGKLGYHEAVRAWNTIRLTSDIIKEFPQLKERQKRISFKIVFPRTYDKLLEIMKEAKEKDTGIPLLMWLFQEG